MTEYKHGFQDGAKSLGDTLLQVMREGESEGHKMTSGDLRKAILNVMENMERVGEAQH